MATVLDAFALIALGAGEPAADEVELIIRGRDAAITAVNYAQALDVLARIHGREVERLRSDFALLAGSVRMIHVDEPLAARAAELRHRHYERSRCPVSLADCMVLAAAGPGDAVATGDGALAAAAGREGIELVALPRRDGTRPTGR